MPTEYFSSYDGKEIYAKMAEYDSEGNRIVDSIASKQDQLVFDGTYNASTNKAATESTVTSALANYSVSYNQQTGELSLNFGNSGS